MKAGLEAAAIKPALETRRQALFAKTNKAEVKKDDYQAIRLAAQKGEFEKIQSLFSFLDKREKAKASYLAIHWAAKGGHIKIMDYLIGHLGASRAPNTLENQRPVFIRSAMDNARDGVRGKTNREILKTALWGAAVIGVAVLGFVVANIPTAGMLTIIAGVTMMAAAPIALLAWGAKEYANTTHHDSTVVPKHSATIRAVKSSTAVATKTEPKEAIKARNYRAIRWAAQNGHTKTLQYLFSYLSTEEIQEALKAADDQAIRWATRNGHTETHQYLLFLKQRPDAHYASPRVTATSTEKEALLALIKEKTPGFRSAAFFASSAGCGYQALVEYLEERRDELREGDIPKHLKVPISTFATSHGYEGIKDLIEALKPETPSQAAAPNPG